MDSQIKEILTSKTCQFITRRSNQKCNRLIINDNNHSLETTGFIKYFPFCTIHYKQMTSIKDNVLVEITSNVVDGCECNNHIY